jgi:hypothetical protein
MNDVSVVLRSTRYSNPIVRFFDTGHFAVETHVGEIAESIRGFLK